MRRPRTSQKTLRDSSTLAKSMGVLLQIRLFRPIWPKTICPINNPARRAIYRTDKNLPGYLSDRSKSARAIMAIRLSKVGVLAETSMKKSKKHHAIAPLWPKVWECCSKTCFLKLARQSPRSRQNDAAARCSEPPFPTHGGQDDVS